MFSSQHNRFFQPPDSKFGSINSLPLIITTGQPPPEIPPLPPIIETPPPIIEQTPEPQIQPEPQIIVDCSTEFKETQTFYENPLYDDINLEDIYTNYSEDDFEEHKPPKKNRSILKNIFKELKPTYRKKPKKKSSS